MMDNKGTRVRGAQARAAASWIAFAPVIFQATRTMRDLGMLQALLASKRGLTESQLQEQLTLSAYGVSVLIELGISIGVLERDEDRIKASRVAYYLERDAMTRVNMDFVQDVCYDGLQEMTPSIVDGRPAGLPRLLNQGDSTIYQALSKLDGNVRSSWFAFDHYYSDQSFPSAAKVVLASGVTQLMDIGGNTGKFTRICLASSPQIHMTIVDLPGQLNDAKKGLQAEGLAARVDFVEHDLLSDDNGLPMGKCQGIWMSQFLDCFSEEQIVHILKKTAAAVDDGGSIWILEPFYDRQRYAAAEMSLHAISLYFTVMANGNSRLYDFKTFDRLIDQAGLTIVQTTDNLGTGHTLLECKVAS